MQATTSRISASTLAANVDQVAQCLAEAEQAGQLHFGHGTDNAWDEAAALVLHAAKLPLDGQHAEDLPLGEAVVEQVRSLLAQRLETRRPLAYLIGETQFAGLTLACDERALVPRSPLAELIEEGFAPWLDASRVARVLDLCTGGGAIALACALAFPRARIDATDLSPEALQLAAENRARLALQERVRLLPGDLFEPVSGQRYDLIVSNPPYVPQSEQTRLPREYQHEPSLGLFSGPRGLDLPMRILEQAHQYLAADGYLVVELGETWAEFANEYPSTAFTWLEFARGGEGVFLLPRSQCPGASAPVTHAPLDENA